jgi:hypothetical protein
VEEPTDIEVARETKDNQGRYRTKSLFLEYGVSKYPSYFTMADADKDGHISVRRLYMEFEDPTEFRIGEALVGDFRHWQVLCELSWFKPHVHKWRIELQAKMESLAVLALKETVQDKKSSSRVQAARLILDRPWEKKDAPLRGRPSKTEIAGYKKEIVKESEETDEDYERMFGKDKGIKN